MTVMPPEHVMKNAVFVRETSFSKIHSQRVICRDAEAEHNFIYLAVNWMKLHMEKCRAGLWVERVEQVAKSWNVRNKCETRNLRCESCSEINMFEIKALSPTTAFVFKTHCMLLHEFKHPWQTCIFFL